MRAEPIAAPPGRRTRAGFTLVELLIYLVMGTALLGVIYRAMTAQSRSYGRQREILDVRESVRTAAALLAWELRHASVAGSKVVGIGSDSITVRSMQGLGTVCAKHATLARYALWRTSGDIQATANDSAILYRPETNVWRAVRVTQVGTPAGLGVASCSWAGGGKTPDLAIELDVSSAVDTAGIVVGSGYRAFRETLYSEYLEGGRYWLGRKVPPTAADWEKLTGPLLPPDAVAGGLNFRFFDSANLETAIPDNVARVELVLRAQSFKQSVVSTGVTAFQTDSVVSRVVLRR